MNELNILQVNLILNMFISIFLCYFFFFFSVSGVVQRQKELLHHVADTATDYGMLFLN